MVPSTILRLRQYLSLNTQIYNLYGPAECSILATYHLVTSANLTDESIPIGVPVSNYTCHILDEYLSPVPMNTLGELYIGGPGVFTGYLGDNDTIRALNEKVLVCPPGHNQENLFYRTGDLCRLSNDGAIIYAGRIDHQVKIRGQRLELGEVEASLSDPDIVCCAVVKLVDEVTNEEYLAAYIQPAKHVPSMEHGSIQARVFSRSKQILPAFMVPTAWLIMEKLPLNSSDKIDRKQLPKISRTIPITSAWPLAFSAKPEVYTASSYSVAPLEDQVCDIFCQALNFQIDKNQFEVSFGQLGGTSVTAMTIVILIRKRLYEQMDISLLFEHSTIRQLSAKLVRLRTPQPEPISEAYYIPMANDTVIDNKSSNEGEANNDNNEEDEKDDRAPPFPSLCHTFEHRLFQLAPSYIGQGSILDHSALTFPDCKLEGNNRVYPCTLILKGDWLPKGTMWKGNPPRQSTCI
ncbi:unnamed protein product [Rotaria sp. Silwood1]|nr:unnamed protein product [Rotaria sp. Silwood1]